MIGSSGSIFFLRLSFQWWVSSAIYAQSQWCWLCILLGHTVISYFLSTKVLFFCFLLAVVVSASENTCIEMFFNKFEANGREFFNITWEFIEKKSKYKCFWHGRNNSEEKQKNKTLVERDITFLYHCWVFLSIRTIG